MKINSFKKTGKGKYKIYLDNGDVVSLYEDVIVNNNLILTKEIDNDKLDELVRQNNVVYVYGMALNYISIRLRSEKELREYLIRKEVSSNIIDTTCKRLIKESYINDFNFAKVFLNDQMILTPSGPFKVCNELLKRGVSDDIVKEVIEDINQDVIKEKLHNLIEKQIRIKKGSTNMLKMKVLNYFINLGYEKQMILDVLSGFKMKTDINHLQKEYDKLYNKYKKKYEGYKLNSFIINKLYSKGYNSEEISKIEKGN